MHLQSIPIMNWPRDFT